MYDDITDIYAEIFPLNQSFLKFIQAYLGSPGSKVLDLGCGPGDYVDLISRNGYSAIGIDSSSEMINQAKQSKRGRFYNYSFSEIDQLDETFDCVYSIGNSLSYLSVDLVAPLFNDVFQLMNNSGYFIIQVVNWDKYFQTGSMIFDVKTLLDGRTFHRRYQTTSESTVIFHTELRKKQEMQGSWSDILYPKLAENLISLIQESGFVVADKFGDFSRLDFDPLTSPATILVAKKFK